MNVLEIQEGYTRIYYGHFFSNRTIISKPLESAWPADEKSEILEWRKLEKVKDYIDERFYVTKVNVIDPSEEKCFSIKH